MVHDFVEKSVDIALGERVTAIGQHLLEHGRHLRQIAGIFRVNPPAHCASLTKTTSRPTRDFPRIRIATGNAAGNDALFLWHDDQLQLIAGGSGDCAYPTISADGQRILFKQSAPDGPGNDNNGFWPIQLYDIGSGRMSQVVSVESYDPQLSRDGQWVLFRSYADLAGSNPNGTGQLFAERVGGSVRQLTQIADRQTYFDFASNADASRIAAMLSRYDPSPPYTQSSEGLLFTSAGVGSLPGVPIDAQSLSFDAAGRLLAFISSQDPVRQNPQHVPQVFVAVIPLEVETPSPTSTPTPGSSMCVGDCDGSQAVTVDEILTMVNIAPKPAILHTQRRRAKPEQR